LQTAIREVVNGERRQLVEVVEATNRRGRAIKCRVSAIPLASYSSSGEGLLVVMEELSGS
jgi:two-component system CheB/CheR fusion protein